MAPQNRPPVKTVFFAFRIMLAIGFFMIAAALIGAWLLWRGMLFETRWYLRIVAHRLVDRLRRRHRRLGRDRKRAPALGRAGHPAHRRRDLAGARPRPCSTTLVLFVVVYAIVFAMGIYYINRLIARGPQGRAVESPERGVAVAADVGRPRRRTRGAGTRFLIRPAQRWERPMEWDLPLIWAGVIGLAVALYVILDGFDLGVGILFPFSRNEKERDQMIASIAPFWDGNETWLVLGGGGLWVAFPRAYGGDHVGALSAGHRDAAGAGVPRRRVRVPHRGGDQQALLEFCVRRRLHAGGVLPGRHSRRADPGHHGEGRRLRRRTVRLGDAFRAAVRARRGRRLCACSAPPGW